MSFDGMAKIVHQQAQRQKVGANELVKHEVSSSERTAAIYEVS